MISTAGLTKNTDGICQNHKPFGIYEKYIKRPLDVFVSTSALIVLGPILLIIAIFIKIKLGSPILFTQERPGKDKKIFRLIKFRSMSNAKDEEGHLLPDKQRLNRFGKILRSTSLDELPELINIIKGDMALVGPRPLLMKYLDQYNDTENRRHEVRPGLTGLAQISGRNATRWRDRFEKDIAYVDHITFTTDATIILHTIKKSLKREGIEYKGTGSISSYFASEERIGGKRETK